MALIDDLSQRVTALDGVGAQVPSRSAVPTIYTDLNGLHGTINQLTLTIQGQLNTIAASITTLQGTVNNLLGLPVPLLQSARAALTSTGTTGVVDVLFPAAYADNNYTASVAIETLAADFSVTVVGFVKKPNGAGVTVMYNAVGAGRNATAHVIAQHS